MIDRFSEDHQSSPSDDKDIAQPATDQLADIVQPSMLIKHFTDFGQIRRDFHGFITRCYVTYNDLSLCCLLYTSPSPRDKRQSRMPSSA